MDIPTTLVTLAILVLVAAFIVRPLVGPRGLEGGSGANSRAADLRRRANLLAERNSLYRALRDLDFDFQTGKMADADYAAQRRQLVQRGVETLQQLDALPDGSSKKDSIEMLVQAAGGGPAAVTRRGGGGFCPNCGLPIKRQDKFCGSCGAAL